MPLMRELVLQAVRDVTGELMPLSPSHSAAATEAALSAVAAGVQFEEILEDWKDSVDGNGIYLFRLLRVNSDTGRRFGILCPQTISVFKYLKFQYV